MILETVTVGIFAVNCYILAEADAGPAIIIDPGADEKKIREVLAKHKLAASMVINTHGHFDHIGCDDKFGVPIYIHRDDAALLKDARLNLSDFLFNTYYAAGQVTIKTVEDGDSIELGSIKLEIIATPGHTRGGICLLLKGPGNKILFSGDTLFYQGVGRTDFPGASESDLARSIKEKLFKLPDDTLIYPGHGPSSTIGGERRGNPFFI